MKRHNSVAHKNANNRVIGQSGIMCMPTKYGNRIRFRNPPKPKIDYYPSTDRWICDGVERQGTVDEFIKWYLSL